MRWRVTTAVVLTPIISRLKQDKMNMSCKTFSFLLIFAAVASLLSLAHLMGGYIRIPLCLRNSWDGRVSCSRSIRHKTSNCKRIAHVPKSFRGRFVPHIKAMPPSYSLAFLAGRVHKTHTSRVAQNKLAPRRSTILAITWPMNSRNETCIMWTT